MSDAEAQRDFPDQDQRAAFCLSRFRQAEKRMADDYGPVRAAMEGLVKSLGWTPPSGEPAPQTEPAQVSGQIVKADEEQRIVFGWATVSSKNNEIIVDSDGESIEPSEMEKAANEFMKDARVAKAMHDGDGIGEVIHSLPVTNELAKALGIESEREGWIIGVYVKDDDVWQRVKSGELSAFSIGGSAEREA